MLRPSGSEKGRLRFNGRQTFLLERTRPPPMVFTKHRNTKHESRHLCFSRITKHESRNTAFFRNTAFSVARMVHVGTEALQSCFFRSGMLGIRTGCRKSPGSTCLRRCARRGRRPSRTLATRPLSLSRIRTFQPFPFTGRQTFLVERTRPPNHGFHEIRITKHESRLFFFSRDPKHGFFRGFYGARWY